jgi:hypothetical protein
MRSGEHIGVPVTVQVRGVHAAGPVGLGGEDLLAAEGAAARGSRTRRSCLSPLEAESTSASPSPSRSVANTL